MATNELDEIKRPDSSHVEPGILKATEFKRLVETAEKEFLLVLCSSIKTLIKKDLTMSTESTPTPPASSTEKKGTGLNAIIIPALFTLLGALVGVLGNGYFGLRLE